ncbi:MAG: HAMP domain-containing sensor histidine kinase [Polyangiaceae bacterium]
MTTLFIEALREARATIEAARPQASTAEPGEATVARRLLSELDDAIAHLDGSEFGKDLVSIVCHDLKDPLASIVMGAGFLRKTIPADQSAARRVVDAISRSADRMSQLISDFHDLARLEAGALSFDPRRCEIVPILSGAIRSFEAEARERRLEVTLTAEGERLAVMGDPVRLTQLASKLIANAVKFTAPGGRVLVHASEVNGRVRMAVNDTGRGIPADRFGRLFDYAANARRTPRDGPGLGLAIVRGLVDLHHGDITVESRVGEGSTFAVVLPRASANATPSIA